MLAQTSQPLELRRVVLAPDLAPVRYVDGANPHTAAGRPEQAGLLRLALGLIGEAGHDIVEPDAAENGDTVPLVVTARCRLVTESGEGHRRKVRVSNLRLLQAQDVGPRVGQPLLHTWEAGLERVHVPGGDPHPRASLCPMDALLWSDYL